MADLPVMVDLLRQLTELEADFAFDPQAHREGLELLLKNDRCRSCVVVAESTAGKVIGMASGQVVVSTALGGASVWVEDVVVERCCRGEGVGSSLLQYLEKWAASVGAGRLQLLADRSNCPALEFYGKNGWRETAFVAMRRMLK